jgi:hypothetical protein
MRWLALALVAPLLACEPRVIIVATPTPSSAASPLASGSAVPPGSPGPSPTPARVSLRPIAAGPRASRLISYERGGDIAGTSLRFLLTDDGRVITEDTGGDLVQRRLTPSGAAAMVLRAIETGLFDKDASYGREPLPGTTPPGRGTTVLILVVANGPREVRVSVEPTGQPDDDLYRRSATREKLTALARGYEDLSSIPASQWAEATPQPFQPAFRLFVLVQPNVSPLRGATDADAVWPFLAPIESVGERITGDWRCVVLADEDARTFGDALTRAGAITRYGGGSRGAYAELAWRAGTLRLQLSPLFPHEPATCAGAAAPL